MVRGVDGLHVEIGNQRSGPQPRQETQPSLLNPARQELQPELMMHTYPHV